MNLAQMQSLSLMKFASPLCERTTDKPVPAGTDVLVKIERCGVCHSDVHLQDGYFDAGNGERRAVSCKLPLTLGHEIAGVVEAVGTLASSGLIGKRLAVFPWIGCGNCDNCKDGDENLCTSSRFLGIARDGGFASHVLIPHERYLLDYGQLPANTAATLMCSGVTAYAALKRLAGRPRQRRLLLIGMGGVGMMGLALARHMFDHEIAVADVNPAARELALKNGAAQAYDPTADGVAAKMVAESGGFDGIVDFAGNDKSLGMAISVLRLGGKIVVAGLMGGSITMPTINFNYKRMTIEGIMVGTLQDAKDVLDLAKAHRIEAPFIMEAPMQEAQHWLDEMRAGNLRGRTVLTNA